MARIVGALACTLVAATSHAETEFCRVLPGSDFAVMNPQTATVTGQIRLIARVGEAGKSAIPFTLPANSQQRFPDLLATTFSTASANIIAVESSDIVRTNATKLPLATPSRTTECTFRAAGGAYPIVLVGLLSGSVSVTVVDRATGASKTAGPFFAGPNESTVAVPIASLFGGTSLRDGYARITTTNGAAVVTSSYVPARMRTARHPGMDEPIVSVQSTGCASAIGSRATVVPVPGVEYSWSIMNGVAEGATTNTLFAFTLGEQRYAVLQVTARQNGVSSLWEYGLRINTPPTLSALTATDAIEGAMVTVSWTISGDARTGILYGTDFPTNGLEVNLATGRYTYASGSAGSKSVQLAVGNACGTTTKTTRYEVSPPVPSGSIVATPSLIPFGRASRLEVTTTNLPADKQWIVRSALGNYFNGDLGGNTGTGNGTFLREYFAGNEYGLDTITLEVDGVVIASTQIQHFLADFSGIERTQVLGTSRAFTVRVYDLPPTKRWTLRSAGGSTFDNPAGMGSGSFPRTVHFHTAIAGIETLSLEVDGVVIVQVPVQVVSGSIVANPTTIVFGANSNLTVTVTNLEIPGSRGWVLRSANGNLFDVVGGTGSGTFQRTFHAIVRSGLDTLSLEADGVVIATTQIQVN